MRGLHTERNGMNEETKKGHFHTHETESSVISNGLFYWTERTVHCCLSAH